jgi:hypothetical protein
MSKFSGFEEVLKEMERKGKVRENVHDDKKLRFILGSEQKSRYVAVDFDDDIVWFAKSDEESVEIQNADEKLKSKLRTRVIALKKAKKVENVKVVSRTEKGKLVGLWLVKK